MKRFISVLISFFVFYSFGICQSPDSSIIESFSVNTITEAIKLFVSYINWVYILVFMISAWLINDPTDAINVAPWLEWLSKVPKSLRSLIVGIILIVLFAWAFKLSGRLEIFKMILSLLLGLVIYKFGINKIFALISSRVGLKFE